MKLTWKRFDELKYHLIWQTALYAVFMGVMLFIMGLLSKNSAAWDIAATSLASSAYAVFALPKSVASEPKRMFLAYVIATAVGLLLHFALGYFIVALSDHFRFLDPHFFWVVAGITAPLSMVLMILFGAQHPPAVGIALSMVIDVHTGMGFLGIWISFLILMAFRLGFAKRLRDLVE